MRDEAKLKKSMRDMIKRNIFDECPVFGLEYLWNEVKEDIKKERHPKNVGLKGSE